MRRFFKWRIWRWILLGLVIVHFILIHFFAPLMIIGKRPLRTDYPALSEFNLSIDTISVTSSDALQLYGVWCHSNIQDVKGTVLMIHGIGSCKDRFLPYAEWLANQGYQSLLIDLRAHGMSEGDYVTYGYYEVDDIMRFVDTINKQYKTGKIGIWGQSLGAAISLQTMAKDSRISFGIIESTYSTFDEVVIDYSKRIFKISLGWINDYVIWRAQSIASFDKTGIHPEKACEQITQPILLVHGTADDRIDVSYAKRNFKALASKDKELYLIEGANHVNIWEIGGESYHDKCSEFLNHNTLGE